MWISPAKIFQDVPNQVFVQANELAARVLALNFSRLLDVVFEHGPASCRIEIGYALGNCVCVFPNFTRSIHQECGQFFADKRSARELIWHCGQAVGKVAVKVGDISAGVTHCAILTVPRNGRDASNDVAARSLGARPGVDQLFTGLS